MELVLLIGILLSLLVIFLQDWKYRKIHILLPVALFALSFQKNFLPLDFKLKIVAQNTVFFLGVFVLMMVYMSLKNKAIKNPFENYFGLGDFLFYLAIIPIFELNKFIGYFIFSMVFAIVLQQLFKKKITHDSIPLAGFSAILLGAIIIADFTSITKLTLLS